jgi:glycosyltransferase involved in cell wall biosynthesis
MEKSDSLVTVLMPVFNGGADLRLAIDSILNQSYSHFEFLIIDDGSTDESAQLIASYTDDRIRFLQNPQNMGLVVTLNRGIDEARGTYIARMDADDVSLPSRLATQVALLEQGPPEGPGDIGGSYFEVISEIGALIRTLSSPLTTEGVIACLANTVPFAHGSVMLRTAFLNEHQLRYRHEADAEDFDLWVRIFEAGGKFVNSKQVLYQYRDYGSSLSKTKAKEMEQWAKKLRRQFVARNLKVCQDALKTLLPSQSSLEYRDQLNLICLAFRVGSISGKWSPYLRALVQASPKAIAHSTYRLLRA